MAEKGTHNGHRLEHLVRGWGSGFGVGVGVRVKGEWWAASGER